MPSAASASATTAPAPPATVLLMKTTRSCVVAGAGAGPRSTGFTERMLATVAFSSLPAASAGVSMGPKARIAALALAAHLALADGERGHGLHDLDARAAAARIAHGCRCAESERGVEHLPAFVLVGRRHHRHVGNAAKERKIECAMVRWTIRAHQAAAVHREHHRQVLQRDVVDELVVGVVERGVDGDHGLHAVDGKTARESNGVLPAMPTSKQRPAVAARISPGPNPRASRA